MKKTFKNHLDNYLNIKKNSRNTKKENKRPFKKIIILN